MSRATAAHSATSLALRHELHSLPERTSLRSNFTFVLGKNFTARSATSLSPRENFTFAQRSTFIRK